MKIIKSNKRPSSSISFKIGDNVLLTANGAVKLYVPLLVRHMDFFPSSFKLEGGSKVFRIKYY